MVGGCHDRRMLKQIARICECHARGRHQKLSRESAKVAKLDAGNTGRLASVIPPVNVVPPAGEHLGKDSTSWRGLTSEWTQQLLQSNVQRNTELFSRLGPGSPDDAQIKVNLFGNHVLDESAIQSGRRCDLDADPMVLAGHGLHDSLDGFDRQGGAVTPLRLLRYMCGAVKRIGRRVFAPYAPAEERIQVAIMACNRRFAGRADFPRLEFLRAGDGSDERIDVTAVDLSNLQVADDRDQALEGRAVFSLRIDRLVAAAVQVLPACVVQGHGHDLAEGFQLQSGVETGYETTGVGQLLKALLTVDPLAGQVVVRPSCVVARQTLPTLDSLAATGMKPCFSLSSHAGSIQ